MTTMHHEEPFVPRDGQVDYANIRYCPVINCVLLHEGRILIVQRSRKVGFYPGCWNGIAGFLDDHRSVEEHVVKEVEEETGISANAIHSIQRGPLFEVDDDELLKTWIIHPILVEVNTDNVTLDFEAEDYRWIEPSDLPQYSCLSNFDRVVQNALSCRT